MPSFLSDCQLPIFENKNRFLLYLIILEFEIEMVVMPHSNGDFCHCIYVALLASNLTHKDISICILVTQSISVTLQMCHWESGPWKVMIISFYFFMYFLNSKYCLFMLSGASKFEKPVPLGSMLYTFEVIAESLVIILLQAGVNRSQHTLEPMICSMQMVYFLISVLRGAAWWTYCWKWIEFCVLR